MNLLFLSIALFGLVAVNVLVTLQVVRGAHWHKGILVAGIWLLPVAGALLAFRSCRAPAVEPYPVGGEEPSSPVPGSL
jgi:hypothetical protein